MKKELILQGMGWGHMPRFLIARELQAGKLHSISGRYLKGGRVELVAARRRQAPHGPVASPFIAEQTAEFEAAASVAAESPRR